MAHLSDVRGYDAVDPRHYVELLMLSASPGIKPLNYARTMSFIPRIALDEANGRIRLPPIMNLLGIRYLVFRGGVPPTMKPVDRDGGFVVMEVPEALPRAFVPMTVESAPNPDELLRRLGDDQFNPRELAFLEGWNESALSCRGSATIIEDVPGRTAIRVVTDGPGVLVLADSWFEGWEAQVNGEQSPIFRADHALRAVKAPSGESEVVFTYRPSALSMGLRVSAAAALGLLIWFGCSWVAVRRQKSDGMRSVA